LWSVYVPALILSFGAGMLTPVMPLYARSFEASYALVGLVLAAQGIGTIVGDVPSGVILSKYGHKLTMVAGVGTVGFFMLAMSWARSVPELIAYGLLAGIGSALWNISRHAYMTTHIDARERGRVTATFGGVGRIGSFAGPAVGATLGASFGLRVPFVAFAAMAVLAMVIAGIFVENTGERAPSRGGLAGHGRHLRAVVREHFHVLTTAGFGQLLAQMVRAGRNSIIPLYAADVLGLSLPAIGWIVTLSAFVDMAMFYPAGVLMDRYGRKWAIVPSFFIQGVGMALVALATGFGGLLAASMVIGFGNGLGSGSMLTVGSDLAPKRAMGEFLGVWRLVGDVGNTGAPIVAGAVADVLGLSPATLVMALVGMGAAAVFAWYVPETRQLQPSPAPSPGD
jgi:MFS family permease